MHTEWMFLSHTFNQATAHYPRLFKRVWPIGLGAVGGHLGWGMVAPGLIRGGLPGFEHLHALLIILVAFFLLSLLPWADACLQGSPIRIGTAIKRTVSRLAPFSMALVNVCMLPLLIAGAALTTYLGWAIAFERDLSSWGLWAIGFAVFGFTVRKSIALISTLCDDISPGKALTQSLHLTKGHLLSTCVINSLVVIWVSLPFWLPISLMNEVFLGGPPVLGHLGCDGVMMVSGPWVLGALLTHRRRLLHD